MNKIYKYDQECKKFISNISILSKILQECIDEVKGMDIVDIHQCIEPGTKENDRTDIIGDNVEKGNIRFDILFHCKCKYVKLIVNIEIQNDANPGYSLLKRALYYVSVIVETQYGTEFTNSNYENIEKVYSLWIVRKPKKKFENSIVTYTVEENRKYTEFSPYDHDLICIKIINLGDDESAPCSLLHMLDLAMRSTKSTEEKERIFKEKYNITFKGNEVDIMCNLGQGIYDEGKQEGILEGRIEGRAEGEYSTITKLLKLFSLEEVLNMLDISHDEYEELKESFDN